MEKQCVSDRQGTAHHRTETIAIFAVTIVNPSNLDLQLLHLLIDLNQMLPPSVMQVHTHACGSFQQQQPRAVTTGRMQTIKGAVLPSRRHVAAASAPVADCTPTAGLKVVGLCGSLRDGSLTRKALEAALQGARSAQCNVSVRDVVCHYMQLCQFPAVA